VYSVRVQLTRYLGASFDDIPAFDHPQRLELSVDGTPLHVFELAPVSLTPGRGYAAGPNRRGLDADWQFKFSTKAGPRTVALAFLNRTPALLENLLEPFNRPVPGGPNGYYTTQKGAYLRSVEISGPYEASRPASTPSRDRIFICQPSRSADEDACARKILTALGRRAFRRPVVEADLQSLLAFYKEGREAGDFEVGIERAVEGLLVSPEFLYRIERDSRPDDRRSTIDDGRSPTESSHPPASARERSSVSLSSRPPGSRRARSSPGPDLALTHRRGCRV
jgi:hypothetical protein